jgi:hypothetical protein
LPDIHIPCIDTFSIHGQPAGVYEGYSLQLPGIHIPGIDTFSFHVWLAGAYGGYPS